MGARDGEPAFQHGAPWGTLSLSLHPIPPPIIRSGTQDTSVFACGDKGSPFPAELGSQGTLRNSTGPSLGARKGLPDGLELQPFKFDGTRKADGSKSPWSSSGENQNPEGLLFGPHR